MFVFNTLEVDGRVYSSVDLKKIIPAARCNLPNGFYGGRVKYIGTTDTDILLLMSDANTVIDTGAKNLDNIPTKLIRELCKRRKFDVNNRTTKEEMIDMLGR